jgi:hypothetical protein
MSDTGMTPPPPPPPSAGGGGDIPSRGLGDILSAAWALYTANAAKLIGVVAVFVVPLALVSALVRLVFDGTGLFVALLVGAFTIGLAFVMSFAVMGAVTRAAGAATVGDPLDIETSYRWAFSHLGGIFVVAILAFLAIVAGLILFVIPGLIIAIMLSASVPAFVVEGKQGTDALARSWDLVKGNFWHAFGVLFVTGLLTGIVTSVLSQIGSGFVIDWITDTIGNVLVAPYSALVGVLLYVDLRAKSEGLTGDTLRAQLARTA